MSIWCSLTPAGTTRWPRISPRRHSTRSGRSLGRGLARVDPSSANTLIAFAAAPGQVALDGTDRNSPFASAFLRHVGSKS